MVAGNKDKKLKVAEKGEEDNNQTDEELVLSIEKLQEIQDDLEKVVEMLHAFFFCMRFQCHIYICMKFESIVFFFGVVLCLMFCFVNSVLHIYIYTEN